MTADEAIELAQLRAKVERLDITHRKLIRDFERLNDAAIKARDILYVEEGYFSSAMEKAWEILNDAVSE